MNVLTFELTPRYSATSGFADNRLLAVVLLHQNREPELYLIPMKAWLAPNRLLVGRDYEGKVSKPEWGASLSAKNQELLDQCRFEKTVATLT